MFKSVLEQMLIQTAPESCFISKDGSSLDEFRNCIDTGTVHLYIKKK